MFAPSSETISAVQEWLETSGVARERIRLTQSRLWLTFNATSEEAERLLQTEYHLYKTDHGHIHIACDAYSVPEHITKHVDIITPTIHFDRKIDGPRRTMEHKDLPAPMQELNKRIINKREEGHGIVSSPEDQSNLKQGAEVKNALMTLENCDTLITPPCLRALYNMPPGSSSIANNTLGVVVQNKNQSFTLAASCVVLEGGEISLLVAQGFLNF